MNTAAETLTSLYPPAPAGVPDDLTRLSGKYRWHALALLATIVLFFGCYLLFVAWFGWLAYHLLWQVTVHRGFNLWTVLAGLSSAIMSVFAVRALVLPLKSPQERRRRIFPHEHPRLFEFLRQLAADTGVAMPYRVYVSERVNACIFYENSLLDTLFPLRRRSLEIGLGLVNVLSLSDLKAVVAHEFGHLAQTSMVLGRLTYAGSHLATRIITRNDAIETALRQTSRFVSGGPFWWIVLLMAWTVRMGIWSVRTSLDAAFRLLLAAQLALSRRMEFQADLVSVSVSGSDALIESLNKLHGADDGLRRALGYLVFEARRGRRVPDLFALQQTAIEQVQMLVGALHSTVDGADNASLRIFKHRSVQPPDMWASHPSNFDREENCKRCYIPGVHDPRSAWLLFDDAAKLRSDSTSMLFTGETAAAISVEEAQVEFSQTFRRAHLERRYRGVYLDRFLSLRTTTTEELCGALPERQNLDMALESLYGDEFARDVEQLRELVLERGMLEAVEAIGSEGTVIFRGEVLARKRLAAARATVEAELEPLEARIGDRDRRCRAMHIAAALEVGHGWAVHVRSLLELLRYAEHSEARIIAETVYLRRAFAATTVLGEIRGKNVAKLMKFAYAIFDSLRQFMLEANVLEPDSAIISRLDPSVLRIKSVVFSLSPPHPGDLVRWLNECRGWIALCTEAFHSIRFAALDALLDAERQIAAAYQGSAALSEAPLPSKVPTDFRSYSRKPPAAVEMDWLDRWQRSTAPWASVSRIAAGFTVVGLLLSAGYYAGEQGRRSEDPTARGNFSTGFKINENSSSLTQNAFTAPDPADVQRAREDAAIASLTQAANRGSAQAQNQLGMRYDGGDGVPQDPQRAVAWFRAAALKGNADAQANLGLAYLLGRGSEVDYAEARRWLTSAAGQGIAAALRGLGEMYERGLGVPLAPATAVDYFNRAAAKGDSRAEALLGQAYFTGYGVAQDAKSGMYWSLRGAARGEPVAETYVGIAYRDGNGVDRDMTRALVYLREAADAEEPYGELALAQAYYAGQGVARDWTESLAWFQKAAAQGIPEAEYGLAEQYLKGEGTPVNRLEAAKWLKEAAADGYQPAQRALAAFDRSARQPP
ncbi:MAG TPA: M48 family metalloprotease [Steroidobacteraceae bacterium]|jgi:TPR repeat protein/Zn-dependent protease with chaperone function